MHDLKCACSFCSCCSINPIPKNNIQHSEYIHFKPGIQKFLTNEETNSREPGDAKGTSPIKHFLNFIKAKSNPSRDLYRP